MITLKPKMFGWLCCLSAWASWLASSLPPGCSWMLFFLTSSIHFNLGDYNYWCRLFLNEIITKVCNVGKFMLQHLVTMLPTVCHGVSFHFFFFFFPTWLCYQSVDGIATNMSSLCLLLILLFLLLWSLCYTKLPYINCYDMFVVL